MSELKSFLWPKGIVVVGASRDPSKPGHVIFRILLENKRRGLLEANVYAVNPNAESILGEKVYKSIAEVPPDADLGVVVVPAKLVPAAISELGSRGVRAAIIISAGFSEVGNRDLEMEVVKVAREKGVRVLGPNCVGVFSPWSGLDTLFLPYEKVLRDGRTVVSTPRPPPGHVALVSQSGAVGTAALDYMAGEGIGLSHFISVGNKADVDEVEILRLLAEDELTRVILLYVENVNRGREFVKAASEVSKRKPIIALKAGRTSAGRRAAASHTAALAGVDEVYNAAFERCGIIRAMDLEELFDFAKAFVYQPPPRGPRVGILTDGGGAGVMAADKAEEVGLVVPVLEGEAYERLEELRRKGEIPAFAQVSNPVDLTGSATTEMFVKALEIMLSSEELDAVVVLALHQVPGVPDPVELARELARVASRYTKPVLAVDTGWSEAAILERREFERGGVPAYPTPERAVRALGALYRYAQHLIRVGAYESYITSFLKLRGRI